MLSTVEHLHRKLHKRWVPKWYGAFCDEKNGGFHERLGHSFKPVDVGYKRLVTQCRQLAVYAHASTVKGGKDYSASLEDRFRFLVDHYQIANNPGSWRFSITNDGRPKDETFDLYGHAFVIFTMCHLARGLRDESDLPIKAREVAGQTLGFINQNFRLKNAPGFAEALDQNHQPLDIQRRQDPHMHLFEACLFAHEVWGDSKWMEMADEILELFRNYFYSAENNRLYEFFDAGLKPHGEDGHRVKPGHYFEWVWLLQKYMRLKDTPDPALSDISKKLLIKGNSHGYDTDYGGIYDFTDHDGHVLEETKRLWPFAEALKANALMLDCWHDRDELKDRMAEMVRVFETGYIEERGFWTETLNRDLTPATDFMPGTTPYHLYFGIEETLSYLQSRGKSKSLRSLPMALIYNTRRGLSGLARKLFKTPNF